ncbi:hypothetical protein KX729_26550 [Rhizobium sp. XQZ8]|uniref:hypothetical protein n=1 Tax=Rhizobium populisoli TaxID=2859785 RepID=UPI001CA4B382|nr:hypothetical protein [Rhizobium populisoli]MBW6425007.1 hypothetical protein [Rhizobium populisoli]
MTGPLMRGADDEPFHHGHGFRKPENTVDQGVKSIGRGSCPAAYRPAENTFNSAFVPSISRRSAGTWLARFSAQRANLFAGLPWGVGISNNDVAGAAISVLANFLVSHGAECPFSEVDLRRFRRDYGLDIVI